MSFGALLHALQDSAKALSAVVAAIVALVTAVYKLRTHLSRSRLLRSNAFPLPEVPNEQAIFSTAFGDLDTMLVGRDGAVHEMVVNVRSSVLTFIYGESGSGKSTFLKLGLCREFVKRGDWLPIYVDVWGSNWERGPRRALADATDTALRALSIGSKELSSVTAETVFEQLCTLRKQTGRRPLLVFDQIDDYQNAQQSNFRRRETQFLLTPDELSAANSFWKEVSDLLRHPDEPVHLVLATRDDAQDGLHCFEFTKPSVYRLPRLGPEDALTLVQRLTTAAVVRNPENGFNQLTERIATELGIEHGGAILPIQLRMAMAGLGSLSGPLTPRRLENLGGVAALGALYLENELRHSPEAWPVVNALAERSSGGKPKAISLSRDKLLSLIKLGVPAEQLLRRLVAKRILRQRLEDSPDEVWHLYHDYLAAAIVELDRRKRRWFIVLRDAAQLFRLADGPAQWWKGLLSPATQLRLMWERLASREFIYGQYSGFARISLLRLVINLWTLSAITSVLLWTLWQQDEEADAIVGAFHQGGDQVKQYDALWQLASSRSEHLRRRVITRFLSNPDDASTFNGHNSLILQSLGLRAATLDTLSDLSASGPCLVTSLTYIEACDEIALFSSNVSPRSNLIIGMLSNATGSVAEYLENSLVALAPHVRSDDAGPLANRIVDRLSVVAAKQIPEDLFLHTDNENLEGALTALAPQVRSDDAGRLANRIVDFLAAAKRPTYEDVYLDRALAALAPKLKDDQAARLAHRTSDLVARSKGYEAVNLVHALFALAPQVILKADVADHVIDQLTTTNGREAESVGGALNDFATQLNTDQAERAASRIIFLVTRGSEDNVGTLRSTLKTLATRVNGDHVGSLANGIVDQLQLPRSTPQDYFGLARAAEALVPQMKDQQVGPLADRIVNLMHAANWVEVSPLAGVLATLPRQLTGYQAERGANLILERLGKAQAFEVRGYVEALGVLAPMLNSDQAMRGAALIIELRPKDVGYPEENWGDALAALVLQLKDDHAARLGNRIIDLLTKEPGYATTDWSHALALLAPQIKGDQAGTLANRVIDLFSNSTIGSEAEYLGDALVALARRVSNDQAGPLADRIIDVLTRSTSSSSLYVDKMGVALAALVNQSTGDQAERGANQLVELAKADPNGRDGGRIGMAALAPKLKDDQAAHLANRITDLLAICTEDQAVKLGGLLAALTPQLTGDQAGNVANRIIGSMPLEGKGRTQNITDVLAALTARGDPNLRKRLLPKIVQQDQPVRCDLAVSSASPQEVSLLLDMIKWPICGGGDGIMLRIGELQNASPSEFGQFDNPGERSTFRADRQRFVRWLRKQRTAAGSQFDIDGPPLWTPQNSRSVNR